MCWEWGEFERVLWSCTLSLAQCSTNCRKSQSQCHYRSSRNLCLKILRNNRPEELSVLWWVPFGVGHAPPGGFPQEREVVVLRGHHSLLLLQTVQLVERKLLRAPLERSRTAIHATQKGNGCSNRPRFRSELTIYSIYLKVRII